MLIRFDSDSARGPSEQCFLGLVDWAKGAAATDAGVQDFDDYAPFNAGNHTLDGTSGFACAAVAERDGVVGAAKYTATAGSNAESASTRNVYTELDKVKIAACGVRVKENTKDDGVVYMVGLTDQAAASILASNAPATGGSQNFVGLYRKVDGSIDLIVIKAGTLTTLSSAVKAAGLETTAGYHRVEFRIELTTPTQYRITPVIDGAAVRSKAVNVLASALPVSSKLTPCFALGHVDNAVTPDTRVDWSCFIDK